MSKNVETTVWTPLGLLVFAPARDGGGELQLLLHELRDFRLKGDWPIFDALGELWVRDPDTSRFRVARNADAIPLTSL